MSDQPTVSTGFPTRSEPGDAAPTTRGRDETDVASRRVFSILMLVSLVALLAGGGYAAYAKLVKSAPMAAGTDFRPDPPRGGYFRPRAPRVAAAPAAPPQAVTVMAGPTVVVKAGGLILNAGTRVDGTWRLTFTHRGGGPTPDAQAVDLLVKQRRLLEMKRPPADLKLTDAQRSALAALPTNPPELAPAAADQVVEFCKQLTKLPAGDARGEPLKQQLEALVGAAGKGDRSAIVAAYAERAGRIKAILSPEQVQTLLAGTARAAPPASTRPTPAG